MPPDPLLKRGSVGLHPAKHRRVVHDEATIGQYGGEVTVADRERQIPPQSPQDHLGREVPALEQLVLSLPINAPASLPRSS